MLSILSSQSLTHKHCVINAQLVHLKLSSKGFRKNTSQPGYSNNLDTVTSRHGGAGGGGREGERRTGKSGKTFLYVNAYG